MKTGKGIVSSAEMRRRSNKKTVSQTVTKVDRCMVTILKLVDKGSIKVGELHKVNNAVSDELRHDQSKVIVDAFLTKKVIVLEEGVYRLSEAGKILLQGTST